MFCQWSVPYVSAFNKNKRKIIVNVWRKWMNARHFLCSKIQDDIIR